MSNPLPSLYVLETQSDYHAFNSPQGANVHLLALTAGALSSIPSTFPTNNIIITPLSSDPSAYISEAKHLASTLIPSGAFDDKYNTLLYYKKKALLDSLATQIIALSPAFHFKGNVHYIKPVFLAFFPNHENSESLHTAFLSLSNLPQARPKYLFSSRLLKSVFQNLLRTFKTNGSFFTNPKRWKTFALTPIDTIPIPLRTPEISYFAPIHPLLIAFSSGELIRVTNMLRSLLPIIILTNRLNSPAHLIHLLFLQLDNKTISMTRCLHHIISSSLNSRINILSPTYSTCFRHALALATRNCGGSVSSFQHALVGHDSWSAAQYIDLWPCTTKSVATLQVFSELSAVEDNHFGTSYKVQSGLFSSQDLTSKHKWDGTSLVYALTGVVSRNIMYDNRRLPDLTYFQSILRDIEYLSSILDVLVVDHPYNYRHYPRSLFESTFRRYNVKPLPNLKQSPPQALVYIDSPTTVLATLATYPNPVAIVNKTCLLSDTFRDLCTSHHILFDSPATMIRELSKLSSDELIMYQTSFRDQFSNQYLG